MDNSEYQKLDQEFSRFLVGDPNSSNPNSAPNPYVMNGPFICSRCNNVGSPLFDHTGKLGCYVCNKCTNDYRRWSTQRYLRNTPYRPLPGLRDLSDWRPKN
jgi:hypothetical protein